MIRYGDKIYVGVNLGKVLICGNEGGVSVIMYEDLGFVSRDTLSHRKSKVNVFYSVFVIWRGSISGLQAF